METYKRSAQFEIEQGVSKRITLLKNHFHDWHTDRVVVHFLLVLAIIFTASKAFSSVAIDTFPWRFLFWLTILGEFYLVYGLAGAVVTLVTGKHVRSNLYMEIATSIITSIFMAAIGRCTLAFFIDKPCTLDGIIVAIGEFMSLAPIIAVCVNRVRAKFELAPAPKLIVDVTATEAANLPVDEVCTKNPLYIEAEDHHIKIVYDDEVVIKRETLANEISNWGDCGDRVHRSYWVSYNNVVDRMREGRRLYLLLRSGVRVPVGRSFESQILSKLKLQ